MRFPEKFVAIDIETTDVDYNIGEIIQLGAVIVNEDLTIGATFSEYLKPLTDYRNPDAMNINKISEDILLKSNLPIEVLDKFSTWAKENTQQEHPMLASWGSFDVVFLKETYRKLLRDYIFSYRSIDLKSIAIWESARRDVRISGGIRKFLDYLGLEFEGQEHDAVDDVKNSLRIIKKLNEQNSSL